MSSMSIRPRWVRGFVLTGVCTVALGAGTPAMAQSRPVPPRPQALSSQIPTELDQQKAEVTREEFRRLLENYPPALSRILKLDPTLMSSTAYLEPYPVLGTYLQRHPEISRYPDYFLDFAGENYYRALPPELMARRDTINSWKDMFFGIMVFVGFLAAVATLGWLIRYAVAHRRWLRSVKIQTDVHSRLMERFSSNEDLMAYIQSPAGRQFLQGLPAAPELGTAPMGAPLTRILWSVQAGLVLTCAGVGLLSIKHYMPAEIAEFLLIWGVLGVSVGIGFVLAAGASYILSARLGLIDAANDGAKGV